MKIMKIMPNNNANKKVVVAMSGGVDSAVAAAMMVEQGYEVIGLTMQLYDTGASKNSSSKTCCAGQDIYDAKRVSDKLGIPHYTLDYENNFLDDVMKDFANTYAEGKTPIPCIRCNQRMKFRDLLNTSMELGAEMLVTGHYAEIRNNKGEVSLHRARDMSKDQSYFLFATPKNILSKLKFPLGSITKDMTREYAKKFNLPVSDKPESQDICFVQSQSKKGYREIVQKLRPDIMKSGHILDMNGNIIGSHSGIDGFTIGQRRGLGVISGDGTPLYVVKIDSKNNAVYVGKEKDLSIKSFDISEFIWIGDESLKNEEVIHADVQLSSEYEIQKANISILKDNQAKITLEYPNYRVAPGQACVIYLQDRILGGGWISGNLSM
tara:strand:+ start:1496 stop:2632 length:1137 start_codon:yes stop_codon:yes gene_type:complete